MSGYCVRVNDRPVEGLEKSYWKRIQELNDVEYTHIIAVKHNGDDKENPHFHIVIKTQVKAQAFRVRMKKLFPEGKGNAHMSIKPWDGNEDACSYLFHEDGVNANSYVKGWTSDDVNRFQQRNIKVKDEVEKAKGKASYKLEEDAYNVLSALPNPPRDDISIAKCVVRCAFDNDKYVPNDWLLKSIVSRIQFRLCGGNVEEEDSFIDFYVRRVFKKDFGGY